MKIIHVHLHNKTNDADPILEKMVSSLVRNVKAVMQVRKISLSEAVAIVKKESIAGPKSWELALQELKAKDAETKYIAKSDLKLPNGKIVPAGSVFYRRGSKFTPWFEKQSEGYNFSISVFKIENGDASYKDEDRETFERELLDLEKQSESLIDAIEKKEDRGVTVLPAERQK